MTKWIILALFVYWVWKTIKETNARKHDANAKQPRPDGAELARQSLRRLEDVKKASVTKSFADRLQEIEWALKEGAAPTTGRVEFVSSEQRTTETFRVTEAKFTPPAMESASFRANEGVYDTIPDYDYLAETSSVSHFKLNEGLRHDSFSIGKSWDSASLPARRNKNRFRIDSSKFRDYMIMHEILSKPRATRPYSTRTLNH